MENKKNAAEMKQRKPPKKYLTKIDRSFAGKIRPFFLSRFSLQIPCQETFWKRLRLGAC